MNYYKFFFNVLFCLSFSLTFSQETNKINYAEMGGFVDKEDLSPGSSLFNRLFSVSGRKSKEPDITLNNQVFIQQIGTENIINTSISSDHTQVDLHQAGIGNNIQMELSANEIQYEVNQSGDNNNFFHFATSPSEPIIGNFNQSGRNNHVESYGSNSISNGLKINVAGDSKSLIIRNYQ